MVYGCIYNRVQYQIKSVTNKIFMIVYKLKKNLPKIYTTYFQMQFFQKLYSSKLNSAGRFELLMHNLIKNNNKFIRRIILLTDLSPERKRHVRFKKGSKSSKIYNNKICIGFLNDRTLIVKQVQMENCYQSSKNSCLVL